MNVLFLTQGPVEDASARYRVWQYVPWLERQGVHCEVRPAISSERYRLVFRESFGDRAQLLVRTLARRLGDLPGLHRFDVVVFQREVVVRLFPVVEWLARRLHHRMVFDFDDQIFANPPGSTAAWYRVASRVLKDERAPERIVRMSDQVIAGNRYLESLARRLNPNVTMIPTPVDTDRYRPRPPLGGPMPTIGWIGNPSSSRYLRIFRTALQAVAARQPFRLLLVGASVADANLFADLPHVEVRPWSLTTELRDLSEFDIGLMPLGDDPWALGKCGFKAIQYMAMAIPPVCSPIGANLDIVADGVDGYLPTSSRRLEVDLERLIADPSLRAMVGSRARAKVESLYSVSANAPKLLSVLRQAAGQATLATARA